MVVVLNKCAVRKKNALISEIETMGVKVQVTEGTETSPWFSRRYIASKRI